MALVRRIWQSTNAVMLTKDHTHSALTYKHNTHILNMHIHHVNVSTHTYPHTLSHTALSPGQSLFFSMLNVKKIREPGDEATLTYSLTHTHTHTRVCACTHTHTHTHTHT